MGGTVGGPTPHMIGLAVLCLHIYSVLSLGYGLVLLLFFSAFQTGVPTGALFFLLCVAAAGVLELVGLGLRRRKYWAWVTGLCLFGLSLPVLIPIRALGLWGLLDPGSRAQFGIGQRRDGHGE